MGIGISEVFFSDEPVNSKLPFPKLTCQNPQLQSQILKLDKSMPSLYIHNNLFLVKLPNLHHPRQLSFSVTSFSTTLKNVDSSLKRHKKSLEELDAEKSFTVSYLVNSCGLSPERAARASVHVRFKNQDNPDSILALLEKYGFSKEQIADVARIRPHILRLKERTIVPKLEFFLSVGMSTDLLGIIVSREPTWLQVSLENSIIPNYNFLKSVLLTDERVHMTIKQNPRIFGRDIERRIVPNIKVLRELSVPESSIRCLLINFAEVLFLSGEEFQESVAKVVEMRFDPVKSMFVVALHAVSGNANKVTWNQCYDTYSKWGWSKEDIYMAFTKHPNCMLMSEKKISKVMDFLVNKVGLESKAIAQSPTLLLYSLEKRMIPRYSVIQVLTSRGLMLKQFSAQTVLRYVDKDFLDKFVVPYEKDVPKLYDIYKGKVKLPESD